jgi:hypothetical protein
VLITKQEAPDEVQVTIVTKAMDDQLIENPVAEEEPEANSRCRKRKQWIDLLTEIAAWIIKNGNRCTHQ